MTGRSPALPRGTSLAGGPAPAAGLPEAATEHSHDRKILDDRVPFAVLLAGLSALAWVALWVWGRSPYGALLSHKSLEHVDLFGPVALLFVLGWVVMTIAMMLPTSLPLVALFHSMTRSRRNHGVLVALLIVGYVAVWTAFGAIVHQGDWFLHRAVHRVPWLLARPWAIGAAILFVAGLYQFSRLKYRCLEQCRSPFSFIAGRWRGGNERRSAFALGVRHGTYCLGCCWSLMLLMFALGVGSLTWMLGLGAVMAVEKNVSWGWRITKPLGIVLVAWGLGLATTGGVLP
jgi:predicted metal-binding membrane protein